jgi:hypothetical protein
MLAEAFCDGTFDIDAAHQAEKDERKKIKEEKEAADKRNRDAFNDMITNARIRRVASILPSVRLFEGLGDDVIYELAHRTATNPVHTNLVCGFAKDEVCITAGGKVEGLYIVSKVCVFPSFSSCVYVCACMVVCV